MRFGTVTTTTRRFMRSPSLRRSTVISAFTTAILIALFIVLQAFSLSGEQFVQRDLGRFSVLTDIGSVTSVDPGDTRGVEAIADAARRAGAADVTVMLTSFDVRPDLPRPPVTLYVETAWPSQPFPDRYSLIEGKWPTRPGDVVVTESMDRAMASADVVPIFSGNERLRVVGVARDKFGDSARVLAAQGTWGSFGATTRQNFATLTATAALLWNGSDTDTVISAVTTAAVERLPDDQTGVSREQVAAQLTGDTRTRDAERALDRRSWVERIPLAYQLPSLALPVLSVMVIFGLNNRRLRKSLTVLTSVGMPKIDATVGIATAVAAWTMIATTVGAAVGVVLGILTRPICDRFLAGPISPLPNLASPLLRLLATAALSCVFAAMVLNLRRSTRTGAASQRQPGQEQSQGERTTATSLRGAFQAGRVRHALAVVVGAAILLQVFRMSTIADAMILAGAVCLLILLMTPEVADLAIRVLPRSDPRMRLSRQQLLNDKDRAIAAIAVLTTALGAPLAMMTLLATLISTAEADRSSAVAPGQVVLSSPAGPLHAPPKNLVATVTRRVPFAEPPIQVSYLWNDDMKVTVQGAGIGTVLAVDTLDEVQRLNNAALKPQERQTLEQGGMLIWQDQGPQAVLVSLDPNTERPLATSAPIPVTPAATFEPVWKASVSGLLLTPTAQKLKLPVSKAAIVFTNVPDDQATAAEQAALDGGLDSIQVGIYQPPNAIAVPPAFYAGAAGLALIVMVTSMALARTQVITLRSYLGRLMAVGLSRSWVKQVLLLQSATIIAVSTVLAALIAIPPVVIAAVRLEGFVLAVPWGWLIATVATFYLATVMATMISSRRLKPADRVSV